VSPQGRYRHKGIRLSDSFAVSDASRKRSYGLAVGKSEVYDQIGVEYAVGRRTDQQWMASVAGAVGTARSLVNVGAGAGSYEPSGPSVIAIDPSREMLRQRAEGAATALRARAEYLPLRDQAVDVAMAVLTVHHWTAWRIGLKEMRRVAPKQVIIAYDPRLHCEFWLVREYIPEVAALVLARPSADDIADELQAVAVEALPVPWDFADGVFPAHWRRPEAYLDERVRRNCSALAQTDPAAVSRGPSRRGRRRRPSSSPSFPPSSADHPVMVLQTRPKPPATARTMPVCKRIPEGHVYLA